MEHKTELLSGPLLRAYGERCRRGGPQQTVWQMTALWSRPVMSMWRRVMHNMSGMRIYMMDEWTLRGKGEKAKHCQEVTKRIDWIVLLCKEKEIAFEEALQI
jgi:hypothetical protein